MGALGFYDKSYKLMMMPVQNLTHVITPVLHPVLSKHQDDKKIIYNAYYKIVKLLAIIGFPLSVFLYFSATEIITVIYGTQWLESIPVFKLLALTVAIQIVLSSTGSIFQATNRTDLLFYAGLIGTILMLSGIGYGIFIGGNIVDVGYGLIIAFTINFFQALFLLVKYSLGFSYFNFLKVFLFPIIVSIVLAIVLSFFSIFAISNLIASLFIKIFIAIAVFGIFVLTNKEYKSLLTEYLIKKNSKKNSI
jgi:PST family polysaccharide transporter